MNKILKSLLIPGVVASAMIGCTNDNPGPDSVPDPVYPVQIPARISAGTNEFAFNFLHTLQQTEAPEENLFVSPLSLHMALGMLLNGAEQETADEILKALEMEGVSLVDLNNAYKTLINDLPVADSKVKLGLANSLWYRSDFAVKPDFQSVLKNSFNAEATGLPFDNAAKDKINQWASDKTNGKIKKVIEEIKPEHVMFLLNALYFKGDWKYQFDAKNTRDETFKLENGSSKSVKMMYAKSSFKNFSAASYDMVQLPYSNGQFNMTLLVPKGENTVNKMLADFNSSDWEKLRNGTSESKIEVGLPRFTLEYSAQLKATLEKMGIQKAFTSAAELGKINPTADLFVDFVKQDTYLGIDEKGTEAAAVTSIGVGATSAGPNPRIICDRPFALIISENTSNTILFMGRIKSPESK
ncbi:serpin family protein [Dyadobacter chenwenxiniae]|uniref:Serpin family protein n=1 Tax=Dyadobacter chenwenxiniae TaxID=2906456 RepID=A0A9X1PTP6_9BACT|nr:serpin family protein [Dyadobacter chenwenxiniae]MCF0065448.1 serpin family protein [Dyadobacter chenwenxiniae]UON82143.1 serpin family protein [Dyadobacter chenwenxiniae]